MIGHPIGEIPGLYVYVRLNILPRVVISRVNHQKLFQSFLLPLVFVASQV
jgi:hypothetical protein